jgi:hypothetical protein
MYVHNYQIHNVLNDYRKQLSKGPGAKMHRQTTAATTNHVEISSSIQRQSLIDQVSSEIVQRLANAGPQSRLEGVPNDGMTKNVGKNSGQAVKHETEFTYTAIDENDRKSTNTLPVEMLGPMIDQQG